MSKVEYFMNYLKFYDVQHDIIDKQMIFLAPDITYFKLCQLDKELNFTITFALNVSISLIKLLPYIWSLIFQISNLLYIYLKHKQLKEISIIIFKKFPEF